MTIVDDIKIMMHKDGLKLWEMAQMFNHQEADDLLLELTDLINETYSLNTSADLIRQWTPVFLQLALYQRDNLQQALDQYEYPPEYPDLTIDRTKDFTVDRLKQRIVSMHYRDDDGYPETIDTRWQVTDSKNYHEFMFGNRFVVMPDDRVLKFD